MSFYKQLDLIMKQDFGNRGLLPSLPANPVKEAADTLIHARRAIILTGFPVRLSDGSFIGETDGPSGAANLAAALSKIGCSVSVVTDLASYNLLNAALSYAAPTACLELLPSSAPEAFIRTIIKRIKPTHFISLERPGKADDNHYHNMRGHIIDDMTADSSLFLSEAHRAGAVTVSIGDGGNEMGMGTYKEQIINSVPSGEIICASDAADITLAAGVSNWWGWGIAALLSQKTGQNLLPSLDVEAELLNRVVKAGGVDGCTKRQELTVDNLSLKTYLSVLSEVSMLTEKYVSGENPQNCCGASAAVYVKMQLGALPDLCTIGGGVFERHR